MFALLYAVIFYFSRKKPKNLAIRLSASGVSFDEIRLPWQKIQSFWIIYDPPRIKTLNFETAAYLNRVVTLQLEDSDPVAVRDFLLEYLPEEDGREEQLTDKISRKLKF